MVKDLVLCFWGCRRPTLTSRSRIMTNSARASWWIGWLSSPTRRFFQLHHQRFPILEMIGWSTHKTRWSSTELFVDDWLLQPPAANFAIEKKEAADNFCWLKVQQLVPSVKQERSRLFICALVFPQIWWKLRRHLLTCCCLNCLANKVHLVEILRLN